MAKTKQTTKKKDTKKKSTNTRTAASKVVSRQKKVIENLIANGGSIADSMREAGYKEGYARNPQKLTSTKTFQEMVSEMFPPEKLVPLYQQLLDKKESTSVFGAWSYGDQPHSDAIRVLEMINKIQGNYAPEKVQVMGGIGEMPDEILDEEMKKLEEQLIRDDTDVDEDD